MKNLQIKVKKVASKFCNCSAINGKFLKLTCILKTHYFLASSIERKKFRQAETLVNKKASELIAKMNSFKNSEGKLYKLTMQDFEQGYFPWILVEGKNLYVTQN